MMKKRPRRTTPVAKFNTIRVFSCTSELSNRPAEAPFEAARFLPVSLAHDWDVVENADDELETWAPKRRPVTAKAKKSSPSPWKLKVKLEAKKESEKPNKSKESPKKEKKAKKEKKKKRRSSAVDSSSEGKSPDKAAAVAEVTSSTKPLPAAASCPSSTEETPKQRAMIPEKLFALGSKNKPSGGGGGDDGGAKKSYDIAAIKRTLLEQQKSGPPAKRPNVEKTPNPTRPFGRLPGSLLAESAGEPVRPVKRRCAYEPKIKFVKASTSSAEGAEGTNPDALRGASRAGGMAGKPAETLSAPEQREIPVETTQAATSSESDMENAERKAPSPKPLLSIFSPTKERTKPPGEKNEEPTNNVVELPQEDGSSAAHNQEGEVEPAFEVEEEEDAKRTPSEKEEKQSQQSMEIDTDAPTDVENSVEPSARPDGSGVGSESSKRANNAESGELRRKASQSAARLANEEVERSLLEDLYTKFNSQHAIKNSILEKRIDGYKEMNLTREINLNVVKVQLGRLWKACSPSVFGNIVVQLTKEDYATCHRKLFCDVLFQVIKSEKPDQEKDYEICERGLPMLTNKQIKVLALLDALSRTEVMADVCAFFANYIYYALFGVGRIHRMPQFSSINLVRFYLVLLRQGGLEERCRLFLFDMLFFKNSRNHIFICVLIEVWPEILVWPHYAQHPHPQCVVDPIVETVVWMINNTGPANCLRDLMVYEARNWLRERCNVHFPKVDGKDLVKKLLHQVQIAPKDNVLKASTTMGLMLLGKWMDWRWTNNHISFQLLDMLGKSFAAGDTQLLPWVIETIGFVSRVYPVEGREHLSQLLDQIKSVINSDMITEPLERICCLALVRVGHHLQFQVAGFLAEWRPRFPLDAAVEKIMSNFVGTRGKSFAQKTINIHKKGKMYAKKNAAPPLPPPPASAKRSST